MYAEQLAANASFLDDVRAHLDAGRPAYAECAGLLLLCKAVTWGISMGAARGGPTFPGIFLGLVGGVLCMHLPGLAETPAVGALIAAAVVSVLRLPLSAIILTLLITQAGAGVAPLVIVSVVVAYIATLALADRRALATG